MALTTTDLEGREFEALMELTLRMRNHISLPSCKEICAQYETLRRAVADVKGSRPEWFVKEDLTDWADFDADAAARDRPTATTALAKAIMTDEQLHSGAKDVLFMIETAALKVAVESVVESMGNVVKRHGGKSHQNCSKEVLIDWCAQPAYSDEADAFLEKVAGVSGAEFFRRDSRTRLVPWETSKVVDRQRAAGSKMAALRKLEGMVRAAGGTAP